MSTLHTPGPWVCIDGNIFSDGFTTETPIARVYKRKSPHVTLANARLIAAAPELLTELRKARAALQEHLDFLIASHTNPDTGLITDDADLLVIESEQDLINGIDFVIAKATNQ